MSSGLSKCLSRIYHPEGWVRPSWESPAAPRVLLLSLAEEPGLPHSPLAWEAGAAAPPGAVCLQGLALAPGDEGLLQGWCSEVTWCFLHNKAMGCSFILFSLPYYQ